MRLRDYTGVMAMVPCGDSIFIRRFHNPMYRVAIYTATTATTSRSLRTSERVRACVYEHVRFDTRIHFAARRTMRTPFAVDVALGIELASYAARAFYVSITPIIVTVYGGGRACTPRFPRVRRRSVSSINSDHRRPPQRNPHAFLVSS